MGAGGDDAAVLKDRHEDNCPKGLDILYIYVASGIKEVNNLFVKRVWSLPIP
jgi:hypothetical protein